MPDITFLMNVDPAGTTNPFYGLAKQYFTEAGATIIDAPLSGQTLEGVFTELKDRGVEQNTINLVSRAVGFGAIEGPVTLASQGEGRTITTVDDLRNALAAKSLAPPGPGVITDRTRIALYGCDVGRSVTFLTMLSGLFGNPGELLAPRRLSVFRSQGSTVEYRQAQSWTLVRNAPLTPDGADEPTGGWPAYRTQFVTDATDKFGGAANAAELDGSTHLGAILTAAASTATKVMGSTFFIEETIDILPSGSQTAEEMAAKVPPLSNGDPVKAAAQSAATVDDTMLVTTVSGADAYAANATQTKFSITVVLLAQVIDQDVLVAEGPDYARVTSSKGLAPSEGPQPAGGAGGSGDGSAKDQLQSVIDELVALGAGQDVIDALTEAVPKGDATEGLATSSSDDSPMIGEPDYPEVPLDLA